ncbi:hypothetical protein FIBSPDRAFT_867650 [Athelia psychrophila]|uniref:Uncharacterized protein n=1 Tax=Athelia psychrophila TaxID=1759441 RepID=A0A167V8Y7_9AGAM|nr:hypothetical protein FIBSPDRAFT_878165 [Fibularhizoctonia sp. CBS 109695]KZP15036.1 hypothetical protein FIBSPDRAFT_867650 [Fibularhizoctonia sp. CBS 109695]
MARLCGVCRRRTGWTLWLVPLNFADISTPGFRLFSHIAEDNHHDSKLLKSADSYGSRGHELDAVAVKAPVSWSPATMGEASSIRSLFALH